MKYGYSIYKSNNFRMKRLNLKLVFHFNLSKHFFLNILKYITIKYGLLDILKGYG